MVRRLSMTVTLAILVTLVLAVSVSAMRGARADMVSGTHPDRIDQYNLLSQYEWVGKVTEVPASTSTSRTATPYRRPVGSALSPEVGIGVGVSIDQTFDDMQYGFPIGRHVSHYWNGEVGGTAEAGVHFTYESVVDTVPGDPTASQIYTGYNVYNAAVPSSNWPRGQDAGCDLQATDTLGYGKWSNLDVLGNTYAVMAATSTFFSPIGPDYEDNMFYFQGAQFNCTFDPRSGLNTTFIDSTVYRAHFNDPAVGAYAVQPEICTQFDGANTITHALLGEADPITDLTGDDYVSGASYRIFTYYRKVGDESYAGTWSSGQVIDSIMQVYSTNGVTLAASPASGKVCVSYSNPGHWGNLLNNQYDTDVFYRESLDYGLTWQDKVNITTYQNAIGGDPNHFKAWVESPALYDSNDDLHIIWTGTRTSADPYFDGFNWNDFDTDIYHWARSSDEIVKVARGTYLNDDMLTGSVNTLHCGFGGQYSGYIAFIWLSECDGKLYCVWNQMQELLNHGDYIADPTLMEDCAYTGDRISMANWEVMMSVAQVESSSLWDPARHISGTHTPNCGIAGDPEAESVCGNEYKPSVEKYALDESGLDLTWPAEAIVDVSPGGDYSGGWYLNMEYMDDQFPGGFVQDVRGRNEFGVFNSEMWVRLACVEPVEASLIDIIPSDIAWPDWVELGQSNLITATVINEGNVTLNVTEIGFDDAGGGWLSVTENPTPSTPFQVTAGVNNTATFDIVVDASGLGATAWLDGEVWLKSDATNEDSISIDIHLLAAAEVESVVWDTVQTHANMFDIYFAPEGECVALAVGNTGDLGWGAGSGGAINLDYGESGLECGNRQRDSLYLIGATPFTIQADDASGTNARLSQVFNDANQADETGFDPIGTLGSITGGLTASGAYDSVYTGRFVNRDTTIAFERIVYGPRSTDPANETINFVINYTKVYSGDGQAHDHVTIGNVCDWDIPSEEVPNNFTGVSGSGGFLYVQGTDTTGLLSCQSHAGRFGTEAFGGGYTSAEYAGNSCVNNSDFYGFNALIQTLMVDTSHYRDGTDLVPDQPLPDVWWEETAVAGVNADATIQDQAVWFTYVQDHSLGATDTLHFWTVLSTVRDGVLADLEAQVSYAKNWYIGTVRECAIGCCEGRVGDANGLGGDEPTIGDVSSMIDAKFITGSCDGIIVCMTEADVNQSGGLDPTCDDVTIGDISTLIDYLFITGSSLGLNACL